MLRVLVNYLRENVVKLIDRLDMTIAVDWDVKPTKTKTLEIFLYKICGWC